jgi:hypothetical protein
MELTETLPQHKTQRAKFLDQVLASEANKRFKNTDCPYLMIIIIGKDNIMMQKTSVQLLILNGTTTIQCNHSLSFKDNPPLVTSRIKEMYASGLLPGAAYRGLLRQLRSEYKDAL